MDLINEYKKSIEDFTKANVLREKYPTRIPVIVLYDKKNDIFKDLKKNRFIVPNDLTIGQFMMVIRKQLKVNSATGLYLFFNDTLANSSSLMCTVDDKYKDKETNYLFAILCSENTFGTQ